MPCESAIDAWQPARKGRPLKFSRPRDGHIYEEIQVPCGTCILCREAQAKDWTARILHEANQHALACMITLTYSDEHEPEHRSLDYRDLVKFWKRLRKAGKRFQYYAVGEYGDKSLRPHYHACIFGEAWLDNRIIKSEEPRHWTSLELEKAWGKGMVDVTPLNGATAAYAAGYIMKKLNAKQQYVRTDEETGELIPLEQPRSFMSKNLGKKWWNTYQAHVVSHDFIVIGGSRTKPPKAYDRWLQGMDEEKIRKIKERRKERYRKEEKEKEEEKMRARARNAHAHAGVRRRGKTL